MLDLSRLPRGATIRLLADETAPPVTIIGSKGLNLEFDGGDNDVDPAKKFKLSSDDFNNGVKLRVESAKYQDKQGVSVVKSMDGNRDGVVDGKEMLTALDASGDGKLSQDDFKSSEAKKAVDALIKAHPQLAETLKKVREDGVILDEAQLSRLAPNVPNKQAAASEGRTGGG